MEKGQEFFPTNPDLADILGDTDFDFDKSDFVDVWIPHFQMSRLQNSESTDFQISGFPDSQISNRTARGRGADGGPVAHDDDLFANQHIKSLEYHACHPTGLP